MEDNLIDGHLVMELERTSEINRFFDMGTSDMKENTPGSPVLIPSFLGKRSWTHLEDIPRGTPNTPTKDFASHSNTLSLHGTTQEELLGELTRLISQEEAGSSGVIMGEEFSAPSGLFSLSLESPSFQLQRDTSKDTVGNLRSSLIATTNTSIVSQNSIMSTPLHEPSKKDNDDTMGEISSVTPMAPPRSALRSALSSASKKVQFAPMSSSVDSPVAFVRRSPRFLSREQTTPLVSSPLCSHLQPSSFSATVVWARWRPNWYAPAVLVSKASRSRDIWKVKFCHWNERRQAVVINSSDLALCSLSSLRLNDQIFVVRNRRRQTFEEVKFKGWINETNLLIQHCSGEEVVELNRIIVTRQLFGVISQTRVAVSHHSTPSPKGPLIPSSNRSESTTSTPRVHHSTHSTKGMFEGFTFWITLGSMHSQKQKTSLKRSLAHKIGLNGGLVLEEKDETVEKLFNQRQLILLSNGPCRTTKTLISILLKYPIVDLQWIDDCVQKGKIVPFKPYLIPFSLKNPKILNQQFLADWSVALEGSFKFISAWKLFLQIAGATICHSHHNMPSTGQRLVLAERPTSVPASVTRWAIQRKIPIESVDFIIDRILQ